MGVSPNSMASKLRVARERFRDSAKSALNVFSQKLGERATSPPFMRKAKSDVGARVAIFGNRRGLRIDPRRKGDTGPLRVLSGRLRNSLAGRDRQRDHIRRIQVYANRARLEFGTRTPYAAAHEYGYKNIPARPFLRPAARIEERTARVYIKQQFVKDLRRRVKG